MRNFFQKICLYNFIFTKSKYPNKYLSSFWDIHSRFSCFQESMSQYQL